MTVEEVLKLPVEAAIQNGFKRTYFVTLEGANAKETDEVRALLEEQMTDTVDFIVTNFPVEVHSLEVKKNRIYLVSGMDMNLAEVEQLQNILEEYLPESCPAIASNAKLTVKAMAKETSLELLKAVEARIKELLIGEN